MLNTPSIENMAHALFEKQWSQIQQEDAHTKMTAMPPGALVVLKRHVALALHLNDQQIDRLKPMIKRQIFERRFVGESGDPIVDRQTQTQIERQAEVVVWMLKQVRCGALGHGQYVDLPLSPQLFG